MCIRDSFEGFVPDIGCSVLSGGRYDSLLEKFGDSLPAIGFSVKLDALLPVVTSRSYKQTVTLCYPPTQRVEALKKAKQLRQEGLRVELLCKAEFETITVKGGC